MSYIALSLFNKQNARMSRLISTPFFSATPVFSRTEYAAAIGRSPGDKVVTAGGIMGTIVDVRDTDVVLKVDESSNTKIKFTRDAIKRVVLDDGTPTSK